jgi:orotidine-5'-phosphate decarboxylase
MKRGKDFIIFPLDVPDAAQARRLVTLLHGHVGMFKVGLELYIRTGPALLQWIGEHAAAGIFLDLKLHDIPATVRSAMRAVADLDVALATVHCGESHAMLAAAAQGAQGKVGVLGVTVLTSVGAADLKAAGYSVDNEGDLQQLVLHKARMAQAAGLSGVVCSGQEVAAVKARFGENFLAVTPGVRPQWNASAKDDQHRIVTPAKAVQAGSDYLVIGRPIREAADPVDAAKRIADEIEAVLPAPG